MNDTDCLANKENKNSLYVSKSLKDIIEKDDNTQYVPHH